MPSRHSASPMRIGPVLQANALPTCCCCRTATHFVSLKLQCGASSIMNTPLAFICIIACQAAVMDCQAESSKSHPIWPNAASTLQEQVCSKPALVLIVVPQGCEGVGCTPLFNSCTKMVSKPGPFSQVLNIDVANCKECMLHASPNHKVLSSCSPHPFIQQLHSDGVQASALL